MMSNAESTSLPDQEAPSSQCAPDRGIELVVCQLPMGAEIVATYESCLRIGGTVLAPVDSIVPAGPIQLVVCQLPSGGDIVTSKETCIMLGGTPIEDGTEPKPRSPVPLPPVPADPR
jgi:hypothetical protein